MTRAYLTRAARAEEGFDTYGVDVRPKVYKGFADKLGAPRRWLRSHVGRPWSKVRSEIFERFDPRTLAGQHIIFDHLLREVTMWHEPILYYQRFGFFVDVHGILRVRDRGRRKPKPEPGKQWRSHAELRAWTAGRRVGGQDNALDWFVVTRRCIACSGRQLNCCCPSIEGKQRHEPHDHYRQDRRLTKDDLLFWASLLEDVQLQFRHPAVERTLR